MKAKTALIACLAALISAGARAQEKAQKAQQDAPPIARNLQPSQEFPAPGHFEVTATKTANGVLMDVIANNAPISEMLKDIAQKANLQLLISDDVGTENVKGSRRLFQIEAAMALDVLARQSNLVLGKAGNTFLIVRVPPIPVYFSVPAPPRPPEAPLQVKPAPDWKPFEFNGSQVYVVPAQ